MSGLCGHQVWVLSGKRNLFRGQTGLAYFPIYFVVKLFLFSLQLVRRGSLSPTTIDIKCYDHTRSALVTSAAAVK